MVIYTKVRQRRMTLFKMTAWNAKYDNREFLIIFVI